MGVALNFLYPLICARMANMSASVHVPLILALERETHVRKLMPCETIDNKWFLPVQFGQSRAKSSNLISRSQFIFCASVSYHPYLEGQTQLFDLIVEDGTMQDQVCWASKKRAIEIHNISIWLKKKKKITSFIVFMINLSIFGDKLSMFEFELKFDLLERYNFTSC